MREFAGAHKLAYTMRYIEVIIGFTLLIAGLYILSPWWLPTASPNANAIKEGIENIHAIKIFACIYAGSGGALLYGIWRDKVQWRQFALFWIFTIILFTVSLQLAISGLRPVTWLANLAVGLIAGIIWISLRGLQKNGRY